MNRKNAWASYTREQTKAVYDFSEDYKKFLDNAKTEREAVDALVNGLYRMDEQVYCSL